MTWSKDKKIKFQSGPDLGGVKGPGHKPPTKVHNSIFFVFFSTGNCYPVAENK